LDSDYWSYFKK